MLDVINIEIKREKGREKAFILSRNSSEGADQG